ELMSRTTRRPIPAGDVAPERALMFGVGLTILATLIFVAFVNVLSAGLSLLASAYYVFVYTRWLKRTTPSNIVIGGAAVALTLLLVPFGMMGGIYFAAAVALGAAFIWYAVRLRQLGTAAAARTLYKFSLSYLALLFVAMVVDRHLPL